MIEKITEEELVAIVQKRMDSGIGSDEGEVSNERQNCLNLYLGHGYGGIDVCFY